MATANVHCLLALLYVLPAFAFVDNYKWKYPAFKDYLSGVIKESDKYYTERQNIEDGYNDEKGKACVEAVKKERWYNGVLPSLTSKRISFRQQFKKLDQDTFEESGKCGEDQQCIQMAYDQVMAKGLLLKTEAISSFKDIKIQSLLQDIQSYLTNCVAQ